MTSGVPQRRETAGTFHVSATMVTGGSVAGVEGAAAPLRHVRNAHTGRAADQTPTDKLLLQNHRDAVKAEGCGNHEPMCGD